MKKIGLTFLLGISLFAADANVATLTDIKEALYKLIVAYEKLERQRKIDRADIDELLQSEQMLRAKIESFLNDSQKHIESTLKKIENRAVFVKDKEDKYDRYIRKYVEKNRAILESIQ